jgi:hypothetical protein
MKPVRIILAVSLLAVSLNSCKKVAEPEWAVTYKIGCTDCFVAYYKPDGTQGSASNQNSDWEYSFEGHAGMVVLVAASNTSGAAQGVTAQILLNGSVLKEHTTFCPISGTVLVTDTLR